MIQKLIPILVLEALALAALFIAYSRNIISQDQLILGIIVLSVVSSAIIVPMLRKPKP